MRHRRAAAKVDASASKWRVEESAASKNTDFAKSFYDNPVDAEGYSAMIANLMAEKEEAEEAHLPEHSEFVNEFYENKPIYVSSSRESLDDALAAAEDEPEDPVREQAVSPLPSEWSETPTIAVGRAFK
jgi:hypothetical protein